MYHEHNGWYNVSLEALNLLSMQTQTLGQYVLPNLHSVDWGTQPWELMPFLRLFMNPGLASVHIEFPDETPHLYHPAAVSLIPTSNLTCLKLEGVESGEGFLDTLYNLLDRTSETLRSVYSDGEVSVAVAEKLFQLPYLRCLNVRLPRARISPLAVAFPSLEKLTVFCQEVGSWIHVLQNIPNPALRKLRVTAMGETPLTEAGIRPLLPLGRLTILELPSCTAERCSNQLNDSIISELAMALPQLKSLSLGRASESCGAATSNVTVASLVALSTNCVDLGFLQLHLNANDITTRRRTHELDHQAYNFTCKLREFSVSSQPLPSDHNDILLITFTILHIFPHLEFISSREGSWEAVGWVVQLFREAPRILPLPTAS